MQKINITNNEVRIVTAAAMSRTEWAKLVSESRTGTWFQSPEAYSFYASVPSIMEAFALGIACGEELRGVCVGYMTREGGPLRQFFTRRAIIPGGPALKDDATDEEVRTLMEGLRVTGDGLRDSGDIQKAIYIETRNFNDFSTWKSAFEAAGFSYKPHLNFHVDTQDFENRLSDNRKRQVRRVVTGDGLPVTGDGLRVMDDGIEEGEVREWYGVLAELYRTKVKTPLFPPEFFLEAFRQGVGRFLLVKKGGHVIGGSMVVADGKCVYEWFECGLNSAYKEFHPSVLATYSGIVYARTLGCNRYDMMGAGEPGVPYGVRDFKAEFGGRLVEHGRFLCVCKPLLYRLGSLGVKILTIGRLTI